jgi:hypothetical protein
MVSREAMSIALYPIEGEPARRHAAHGAFPKEGFSSRRPVPPPTPNAPPPASFPFVPNLVENRHA